MLLPLRWHITMLYLFMVDKRVATGQKNQPKPQTQKVSIQNDGVSGATDHAPFPDTKNVAPISESIGDSAGRCVCMYDCLGESG